MLQLRLTAAFAATAILSSTPLAAQFEGTIDMTLGSKAEQKMTQSYKGTHVRTDMHTGGGQMTMLMEAGVPEMTMLMAEHKMYMKMSMKDAAAQAGKSDMKPPKITDTGKTETIAGKTCSVYRMATDEGKPENVEVCAAKGMGFFAMGQASGPMAGKNPYAGAFEAAGNPEYARLFKDGFFPLRVSDLTKGKPETIVQVTAITPKSIPDAVFQIPAGYTEMKMPGMPKRN
jgi:hypothetical protein